MTETLAAHAVDQKQTVCFSSPERLMRRGKASRTSCMTCLGMWFLAKSTRSSFGRLVRTGGNIVAVLPRSSSCVRRNSSNSANCPSTSRKLRFSVLPSSARATATPRRRLCPLGPKRLPPSAPRVGDVAARRSTRLERAFGQSTACVACDALIVTWLSSSERRRPNCATPLRPRISAAHVSGPSLRRSIATSKDAKRTERACSDEAPSRY
mmetsp:Transcript_34657/g.99933  ORF Transcript_34657/g.99933 Transcript_34657/m.99933 type:complete len:210 (+) Transcript_34657:332-961(+)